MNGKFLVTALFVFISLNANVYSQTVLSSVTTPPVLQNHDFDPPDYFQVGDVTGNVGNVKAVYLAKPFFPNEAQAAGTEGKVKVEIEINEEGGVTYAKAVSGDSLLYEVSEKSALKSKFLTPKVNGQREKAAGYLNYNFTIEKPNWFTVGYDLALTEKTSMLDFLQTDVLRKAVPTEWTAENELLSKLKEIKLAGPHRVVIPLVVPKIAQNSNGMSRAVQRDEIPLSFARQNPEQFSVAQNLIAMLNGRLGSSAKDFWQFNLGIAVIEFRETLRSRKTRREALEVLNSFMQSAPADIQPDYLQQLKNLTNLLGQKYTDQEDFEINRAVANLQKIK